MVGMTKQRKMENGGTHKEQFALWYPLRWRNCPDKIHY